jgi:hypothetical protein
MNNNNHDPLNETAFQAFLEISNKDKEAIIQNFNDYVGVFKLFTEYNPHKICEILNNLRNLITTKENLKLYISCYEGLILFQNKDIRLLGINEYSTFKDSCIDNYFLVYNNSKFIIYNLLTQETVTEVNEYFDNAYAFLNSNSLSKEYLIISYSKNDSNQFNIIKINPYNGNIEQKMINKYVSNDYLSNGKNLLLYLKDLNKFLFTNSYIIDPLSLECE